MNAAKQIQVSEMVDREVIVNDTRLVNYLIDVGNDDIAGLGVFSYDNIENAFTEFKPHSEPETGTCSCCDDEDMELDDDTNVCDKCFEPEAREIMEWWRVTPWFAEKLRVSGEPILDKEYGYWWGRCTSGQAICMDGVIEKIYDRYVRIS